MRLAEGLEFIGRAAVLQAAAGIHVGQHDDFLRAEDLGGVGHELDPAKGDHIGIGFGRHLAQLERIADKIGQVLDLRALIIMRQDHRVALLAQAIDLGKQVGAGGQGGLGSHHGPPSGRGVSFKNSECVALLPRA